MNVRKRLGELLVEAGVIDEAQLQRALAHQRRAGGKLGQALVELGMASEPSIAAALSRKLGYDLVDVAQLRRTPELEAALGLVSSDVAERQGVLPVASDAGSLTVVMSDPSNIALVDELAFRTGRRIRIALAGDRALAGAIHRLYGKDDDPRKGVAQRATGAVAEQPGAERPAPPAAAASERPLSPREAALLDSLQRAMRGEETSLVRPAQLAGALVRILVRKGVATEEEIAQELARP